MAFDSPSPVDTTELIAPSLCLNPDAMNDLAPVQPSEKNLLPPSFPTLNWSEQSSATNLAAKAEKRLCYRHRPDLRSMRAADEIQLDTLQQDITLLPEQDQQIISHIWSLFGSAPAAHRQLVLSGLLTQCCVPQLSFLSNHLQPLLRIDFLTISPPEIAFRILSFLDATSLCHAAQVCKSWKRLADDDVVWHRMCEQHIGLKCTKCGWGLPLLEKKKARSKRPLDRPRKEREQPQPPQQSSQQQQQQQQQQQPLQQSHHSPPHSHPHPHPRQHRSATYDSDHDDHDHGSSSRSARPASIQPPQQTMDPHPSPPTSTSSLSPIESTSRSGWPHHQSSADADEIEEDRPTKRARTTRSPTPPISHPAPLFQHPEPPVKPADALAKRPWKDIYSERLIVERNWRKRQYKQRVFRGHTDGVMCLQFDDNYLITGSYDNTAKVWNIETGECLRTLTGHALCVRALQFDDAKLITGSMDRTLKIWNHHTGACIRTLQGHTDGIVTLDFDSRILASGSADATIKIWNFATGECSTLKGHADLVNKVQIYKSTMLVSASDDTTVKLWDLTTRLCLRTFNGHVGRVQCLQTSGDALISILVDQAARAAAEMASNNPANSQGQENAIQSPVHDGAEAETRAMVPVVVTGGLDNTLKVWNTETGECLNTLFGHVDGIWSLAFDKLRIVSGSLDRTIKVWDTESGRCLYTLSGHEGPVTCVGLGDTRIVSGSDDGAVIVWDYGRRP